MARRLFVEMTPTEQAAYITELQDRRLASVRQYHEVVEARNRAEETRTREKLTDQLRMIERDLASAERALGKVSDRWTKINALRAMLAQGD
jgi:phosphoglycerate-specific signal transduction histidine kinase